MTRKELHKDLRDILNEGTARNEEDAKTKWGKHMPFILAWYHKPYENHKYVSLNGHLEGVYNIKKGFIVNRNIDEIAMGTFNFFSPNQQPKLHILVDVKPYNKWGD